MPGVVEQYVKDVKEQRDLTTVTDKLLGKEPTNTDQFSLKQLAESYEQIMRGNSGPDCIILGTEAVNAFNKVLSVQYGNTSNLSLTNCVFMGCDVVADPTAAPNSVTVRSQAPKRSLSYDWRYDWRHQAPKVENGTASDK